MSKLELSQAIDDAWVRFMFLVDDAIETGLSGGVPDWRSCNVAFDAYDALTQEAL